MYDLLEQSHQNLAFAPASNVNSQTTYGIRIFQEIPLASDADVLRLVGRSPSSLKMTPMKVKLEGSNKLFKLVSLEHGRFVHGRHPSLEEDDGVLRHCCGA